MENPPPPTYYASSYYPQSGYPQGPNPPAPGGYSQAPGSYPPQQGYHQGGTYPPPQPAAMTAPMVPRIPLQTEGYTNSTDAEGGYEKSDVEANFASASFSDKAIRRRFIRKVYLILMTQLLFTAGCIAFFLFHKPTQHWVQSNSWCYWMSYGIFLVTYITLVCCPSVRRSYPANFICLGIFTAAFSYMTALITSFYKTDIILIAVGITAAVCLAITIFAMQTRFDFTMCGGLLFVLCMVLFFFGFACMIVYAVAGFSYILHCVYAGLAALVFSLFLAYDTQMLMGGRKYELSPEEHIFGALQLYLDIVYLFLIILSLFGSNN